MRLTEQNVKEVIVDASMKKAVFVYFFMNAPECEAATKAVTAAITDNNEYVSLVEADVQEQVSQAVAMQLGLQTVPALIVMQNGRPVDALQGDDIVTKLPETIKKFMPSEAELLIREANYLEQKGDLQQAVTKAKQAYSVKKGESCFTPALTQFLWLTDFQIRRYNEHQLITWYQSHRPEVGDLFQRLNLHQTQLHPRC